LKKRPSERWIIGKNGEKASSKIREDQLKKRNFRVEEKKKSLTGNNNLTQGMEGSSKGAKGGPHGKDSLGNGREKKKDVINNRTTYNQQCEKTWKGGELLEGIKKRQIKMRRVFSNR